jgi:hypothetical protein
VKPIGYNFRSACALGIISCFVLFLAASAPHRVHHLFENLQYPGEVVEEQTRTLSLTASSQAVDVGDQAHKSHDHLANGDHGHHHGYHSHSRGNNHKHDHGELQTQSQAVNAAQSQEHATLPDAPRHANTPNDDAHHDNSAQTVCLLQASAQHSHLTSIDLHEIPFTGTGSAGDPARAGAAFSIYCPAPFSQRAPPAIQRGFFEVL